MELEEQLGESTESRYKSHFNEFLDGMDGMELFPLMHFQ